MALTGNVPLTNFTIRHVPPPPSSKFLGRAGEKGEHLLKCQHWISTWDMYLPFSNSGGGGPLSNFRIGHEPPIFKFLEGGPLSNFKIGHEPPIFKFLEGGPPQKKNEDGGLKFLEGGPPPKKKK